ncbi:MAG: YheT family hydrolase [Candidatus Binatia bacterium]
MLASVPPFRPRPPWLGADLQTLRNRLRPPRVHQPPSAVTRLVLPLADGSGDRLSALLERPADDRGAPLLILVHGLTGCEDSAYLIVSAGAALARGHPVLRLNLRGAGRSRLLCRGHYHAGRSEDLRDALAALSPALLANGVLLVGYSLGGNMLLKFLAEYGAQFPIRAAAAVSTPIDLTAAAHRIATRRNHFYHRYLLRQIKAESLLPIAELTADERHAIHSARTLIEFDERFVAPRNGFAGALDYYRRSSAERFLPDIRTSTVIIYALDDPWIPRHAYERVRWGELPQVQLAITKRGGHVGFHNRGDRLPWHDRVIEAFFRVV